MEQIVRIVWSVVLLVVCFACDKPVMTSVVPESSAVKKLALCGAGGVLPTATSLAAPNLQTDIGNSHLAITTTNDAVQAWFDQGLNQLHAFYHIEAYRAFEQVIRLDSTCAMGYWGIAMCQPGFGGDDNTIWQTAIDKAVELQQGCSPIEQDLIQATHTIIFKGLKAAQPLWQAVVQQHFDQPDAIAFAAIMLRQMVTNEQQSNALKTMLETAIAAYPDHVGLGHYYTHVMEVREDFIAAKPIALQMAELAPQAPHMVHMPGHIYFLEGEYAKTVEVFEAARSLEEAYHTKEKMPYSANQNYLHNLHYLAVAHSELGNKAQALEAAERFANISLYQDQPVDGTAYMLLYEGRILPALVHLRFREFALAAKKIGYWLAHPILILDNPIVESYLEAMLSYCLAMEAIDSDKESLAQNHYQQMIEQMKTYEQLGLKKQHSVEFSVLNQTYDIMLMAQYELKGWLDNMDRNQAFVAQSWEAAFELEALLPYDEPPRLMYPVAESLMHLHIKRQDQSAAAQAVALALDKRPKSPLLTGFIQE